MLKVEDLHVRIGNIDILRGVSLEVERGEIVGLIGRNGAGKTTTIKTILGFYKPVKGKVEVDGVDLTKLEPHQRVKYGIAYMPEDIRVFPWLTAEENIRVAALLSGKISKYNELLNVIYSILPEIKKFSSRQGHYLSGGEKRMVALARALATEPKYMLLDELFEGLAPALVERLIKTLNEIASRGVGILVAESNIALAAKLCTKVYLIERGEIILSGAPHEVIAKLSL